MSKSLGKIAPQTLYKYEQKLHRVLDDFHLDFIMELGDISRLIIKRNDFDMLIVLVTEDFRLFEFKGTSELFHFWYNKGFSACYGNCVGTESQIIYDSLETFINKLDDKDYERIIPKDEYG
jgi:hypothetical protein